MRRLEVCECELRDKIMLPASAVTLGVAVGQLFYSYDPDDAKPVARLFAEFRPGDELPDQARFIGSYGLPLVAVFDITPREPNVPATPALGEGPRSHFVALWRDGFRLRADNAWIHPADEYEPLTTEQMIAVATLEEYGYGAVVSA